MANNQPTVQANFAAKTPENNAQLVNFRRPNRNNNNLASKPYPPGYRFVPKDEELIVEYLMKRIDGEPIPIKEISDVNLYHDNPQALSDIYPQLGENEWYYFTSRDRKYKNGSRPSRSAGTGYWKATGSDKPIHFEAKVVGFKKSLVFYEGKPPNGTKTNWIMHEYRVDKPPRDKTDEDDMRLDDFVLCRVYKKSERLNENPAKKKNNQADRAHPVNNPVCPNNNPAVYQAAPLQAVAPLQVADEQQEYEQEQEQDYNHEEAAFGFHGNNDVVSDNPDSFLSRDYPEFLDKYPTCWLGQHQQQQQQPIDWQHSQPPFHHQQGHDYQGDHSFGLQDQGHSRPFDGSLSSIVPNNGNFGMQNNSRNFTSNYHHVPNNYDHHQGHLAMHAQNNLDVRNPRNFGAARLQHLQGQSQGNSQHVQPRETFVALNRIIVPQVVDSSVKADADNSNNPDYNLTVARKRTRY